MPTFNNNGRARSLENFNTFDRDLTSRLPLLHQVTRDQWPFNFWRERVCVNAYCLTPAAHEREYPNGPPYPEIRMFEAPLSCNEFVVGPLRTVNGATGYSLFSRCAWDSLKNVRIQKVEWTLYSTAWGTQEKNGNSRGRNQVLLWTQQNQECCAREGRSDTVTQGVWLFELLSSSPVLHGAQFRLPSSGEL